MLNKEKHQVIMGRILKDIYSEPLISSYLGLKGGTCAYFFYNLSRFSVDLDFDLLRQSGNQGVLFDKLQEILKKYGEIKDCHVKRNTMFFLLSYGADDCNIKLEINTRKDISQIQDYYELREYLGISMLAAKKDYLFGGKLVALSSRSEIAMRDIYDIWFFAKNNWNIDETFLKEKINRKLKEVLKDSIETIEKVKENQILQGLGELVNEKEKEWIKSELRKETIFLLKNFR